MHSIALAQAIQFDCKFTQIDTIGEWVPIGEPGMSDVTHGDLKWLRGIRWDEVDANWVLHHEASHSGNLVERALRQAPLAMLELMRLGELPRRGPIIVSEKTGRPFTAVDFRRHWRKIARECSVPDDVRSMGSRAGQSRAFDHEGEKERGLRMRVCNHQAAAAEHF